MAEEPNTNPAPETPPTEPTASAGAEAANAAPQNAESTANPAPENTAPTTGTAAPASATPSNPGANSTTVSQEELDALLASAGVTSSPMPALKPKAAAPAASADDGDELAAEMAAAIAAEAKAAQAAAPAKPEPPVEEFHAPEFAGNDSGQELATLDMLDDVELDVKVELGRTDMYIEDILQLGIGSVVALNKLAGDPVDVFVNERLVARGEVLVLNENFCVRINEIVSPTAETEPVK